MKNIIKENFIKCNFTQFIFSFFSNFVIEALKVNSSNLYDIDFVNIDDFIFCIYKTKIY